MVSHYQHEEQYQADCPPVHWRHVLRQAAAARGVRLAGRPGAGAGGPALLHPHHGGHTGAGGDGGQLRLGQVGRDQTSSYHCHVCSQARVGRVLHNSTFKHDGAEVCCILSLGGEL